MELSGVLRAPVASVVQRGRQHFSRLGPSRTNRRSLRVMAAASLPPTVSSTKRRFLEDYPKPVPAMYNSVLQELLVQQHFIRHNVNYKYDEVFALGLVSAFDQIFEEVPAEEKDNIFAAYIRSLDEDPRRYRADAAALEKACDGLSGIESVLPNPEGSNTSLQKKIKTLAERGTEKWLYSKFFAVGLFRILELTGVKEPQALEKLVAELKIELEAVNRDLKMYKNVLTKLSTAKELMKEFLERERKKSAERAAQKETVGTDAPVG